MVCELCFPLLFHFKHVKILQDGKQKLLKGLKHFLLFIMFVWTSGFHNIFLNITEGEKKGLHKTGKVKTEPEALPAEVLGPVSWQCQGGRGN